MFFQTSSPTKHHSPTPGGGNSQNNPLLCQKQKTSVSSLLCLYGEISETIFQSIRTTKRPKHSNRTSEFFGLDNLNKNPAWFLQCPKYRFSNIETCPKGPNHKYAKFFRQSHRWAKSPRSRIKILVSVTTCWNSLSSYYEFYSQRPIYYKNFIHKNTLLL